MAAENTSRGNPVAVIVNGTAVLGLGNIGPLASRPVMEGKARLFRKFAGIDVFNLEPGAQRVAINGPHFKGRSNCDRNGKVAARARTAEQSTSTLQKTARMDR